MSPTANGRAWRTVFQKPATVWPLSVRPEASVMVPLMITEAATALALLALPPAALRRELLWLGLLLLAVIWLSTAILQVPLLRRLSAGHDTSTVRRLVATNWLRTLAWTARGWLALALLAEYAS